jgi:hypothetical protein
VCGTTRETSCRGVCCARFLRIFSLLRQLDIVALGALRRAGLLACLRSPASKPDTPPLTTVSLLSDFKAGPPSRSSSCPPVCPDHLVIFS